MANIFTIDDGVEDIVRKINGSQGITETINTGLAFLNYKFQKELIQSQNEYNRKQLFWSRILALSLIHI